MSSILTFIYRNNLGDSTNNGVTSNQDSINLHYGPEADLADLADLPEGDLVLVERQLFGEMAWYCVPVGAYKNNKQTMFGGNFVYTSDSRFPASSPLPVHDRIEK